MFEELLIEAVKNKPCLYDRSLKLYRNKLEKERAWLHVSAAIGVDVEQCQSRWRSLRDRFLKELNKKPTSRSAALEEKEWMFFPALQFLKGHVAPRRKFSNSQWSVKKELDSSTDAGACRFFQDVTEELADRPSAPDRLELLLGRVTEDLAATDNLFQLTPEYSQSSASMETPTTSSNARKRKIVEQATDRFNVLLGVATDFLSKKSSGRNDDFYKVLESYLVKLPEHVQDDLKSDFLKKVFEEIDKTK